MRIAVRRPVLTSVFILLFLVLGYQSYSRLALELTPEIDLPFVIIQTIYPGAGPKEVETQVTKRIEDEAATIADLKQMTSSSRESLSMVFLEFEMDVDVDIKAIEVKDKIDAILYQLPDDVEKPSIQKFDFTAMPVIELAVSSSRSLSETYFITDNVIKDRLATAPGVGNIELIGGHQREIRVAVHKDLLRAYGLSLSTVQMLLGAENLNVPAGRIIQGADEYSIRMVGEFESLEQIRQMTIPLNSGGVVRLRDVADVIDSYEEPRSSARYAARQLLEDGSLGVLPEARDTVSVSIIKKSGANTVATAEGVYAVLEELETILPPDFTVDIAVDYSTYIQDSVRDVTQNIIIGILLTSLLLFIFLHDIRSTIIVAVTMPAALVATFILIDFAGFTLNIISMMGLGIAISTLVTNSIIVLESIARHIEMKKPPDEAAIQGTTEVAVAVLASTLTNVVVFTPIAFMSGIVGQFMMQFGLTVVFATLFSLLMSFTLTPMMASRMLRASKEQHEHIHWFGATFDRVLDELRNDYRRMLGWALRHRWAIIAGSLAVFVFGVFMFSFVGKEFFPEGDEGMATVQLKLPAGTSLEQTENVLDEIDRTVRENVPELDKTLITVGGRGSGVERGQISLDLGKAEQRQRGVKQIVNELRPKLASIPAAEITVRIGEGNEAGSEADVTLEVLGNEFNEVKRVSEEVLEATRGIDGLVDARTDLELGKPEFAFMPDRDQLSRYGLTSGQLGMTLRSSYEGVVASRYRERGEEFDIRVQLAKADRDNVDSLSDLFISTPMGYVPIGQLGQISLTRAESEIRRKDRQRVISVLANISQGKLGDMENAIRERTAGIDMGDARLNFGGISEIMAESFQSMISALLLAIILTFMVLAGIQESVVHPFTVMVTLPLGAVGAAVALFLGGVSLNMMSMMAIVMLVGIVVNNAILIFDYTKQLRDKGMKAQEALVEAAATRLRAIIMMNLAIAISIAPQAMAGSGSEFRAAIAVVTMGGVLVSAVFTLFLLPVLYTIFDRLTIQGRREHREAKLAAEAVK
ncbi:MAG: efflux RND transporter permease subunit [Candidatus Alcyoniella australis]|nr:efflux RND transporter permease subunit [Candidatus Alcyoniella australis]